MCIHTICNIYSTVGRSIANISDPRLDIEAIDRPTMLYILYSTVSAKQTNLLPENASKNDAIFPKVDMAYIRPLTNG